jgi:hypothetical protein
MTTCSMSTNKKYLSILTFFENYFREDKFGKKVYESTKPHIYSMEYINELDTKELIFQTIITHYYGKSKKYEYFEKAMLNYFMIQYTDNHERYFHITNSYGQRMYDYIKLYINSDLCHEVNQCKLYMGNKKEPFAIYNNTDNAIIDGKLQANGFFKISNRKEIIHYMYDNKNDNWMIISPLMYNLLNKLNFYKETNYDYNYKKIS